MTTIPEIRRALCVVWLFIVLCGWTQEDGENLSDFGNLTGFAVIPDTALIRLNLQELSNSPYINQQKEYYLQLEPLAKKTGNVILLAECCYKLATIYMQQSDYLRAIYYVQSALQYYTAQNDDHGRANCYRIMGTLSLLLSPGQAELFFRKSLELSSGEDSINTVITKLLMSIKYKEKNDKVFNEVHKLDTNLCNPLQKSALDYIYSVMFQEHSDLDMALYHIQQIDSFFSVIPKEGYFNSMIQHQLASVYLERGELTKAKQALARSDSICKRDSIRLTSIANMRLRSEIFEADENKLESLLAYKNYSNQLDSVLGLYQLHTLNSLLMQIMLNEKEMNTPPEHKGFYILMVVIIFIGIAIIYYYRDLSNKSREKYHLLLKVFEQTSQIGLSPELKHHFSVIMIEYRKGLERYMNMIRESGGNPEDYRNLSRQMDETNELIDQFKRWLDIQPYFINLPSLFEARKIIGVIVRMLEVVFHSKQKTIQNLIDKDLYVYGNLAYFCIAFEIILFRSMQDSEPNIPVILSTLDNHEFVTFTISSPQLVLSEEIQTMLRQLTQKLQANPKDTIPLQTRAEICLKCVYENQGEFWFESEPGKGTIINFTVPKNIP